MPRKPKQERAQFTYEAIVEASARVLARQGWAKCSTNRIAQVAGVSIGTLYEYFSNKEAILEVLLDRHISAGESLMAESLSTMGNPLEMPLAEIIRLLVDGYISLHEQDPALHRRLSSEVPIPKTIEDRVIRVQTGLIDAITMVLTVHPEASVSSPQLSARLVVDTVDTLTHRWIVDADGTPMPRDQLRDALITMLIHYVATPASPGVSSPPDRKPEGVQ